MPLHFRFKLGCVRVKYRVDPLRIEEMIDHVDIARAKLVTPCRIFTKTAENIHIRNGTVLRGYAFNLKIAGQNVARGVAAAAGIIRYVIERERDPFRYLDNPLIMKPGAQEPRQPRGVLGGILPPSDQKAPKDSGMNPLSGLKKIFSDLF